MSKALENFAFLKAQDGIYNKDTVAQVSLYGDFFGFF
jgi:hypothetical protein